MKFKKYSIIENTYRKKFINNIIEEGKNHGEWIVTEKVHGSNFSLWFNGDEYKSAKRTYFLEDPHEFYNGDKIMNNNKEGVKKIWDFIISEYKDIKPESLTIYGEIFGGYYPHPDVKKIKNAKKIQKGVYYHPDNLFYAIDIKINEKIVDYNTFMKLCDIGNIFRTEPVFKGTFKECILFSNSYKSTISSRLGLPEIKEDNICEGNVIIPVNPKFLRSGSRVILKNKNEKFAEVTKKRKQKNKSEPIILSKHGQIILNVIYTYISENRLRNVISKIGKITDKDFGILMKNMNKDIIEDFMKDFKEDFTKLENSEQKIITKKMNSEVAIMIRKNFLNIIDNTF